MSEDQKEKTYWLSISIKHKAFFASVLRNKNQKNLCYSLPITKNFRKGSHPDSVTKIIDVNKN